MDKEIADLLLSTKYWVGDTLSSAVVPKLGVMATQGAMGLLPGSHGPILKKYIFQGLILKYGLLEFLEFFTH